MVRIASVEAKLRQPLFCADVMALAVGHFPWPGLASLIQFKAALAGSLLFDIYKKPPLISCRGSLEVVTLGDTTHPDHIRLAGLGSLRVKRRLVTATACIWHSPKWFPPPGCPCLLAPHPAARSL
jgi:hypothetical protein